MRRFWAAAAMAVALGAVTGPAAASEGPGAAARASTFSGAFLAARLAEADNDIPAAIAYYERALAFDPDDTAIRQNLLLALIARGAFDEALVHAQMLKEVPEVERFSRLALGIDALRDGDFDKAEYWLKLSLESELDRLIAGLITAWAKLGAGSAEAALAHIDQLDGPPWYGLFTGYHKALIADEAGLADIADAAYRETVDNVSSFSSAPEVYLRAIEAYSAFLARQGDRQGALDTLARADDFAAGRATVLDLRERIETDAPTPARIASPAEGGAEALLNLATALNRGGGESFVLLYLQYAAAATPDNDAVLVQLAGLAEQQRDAQAAIDYYERVPETSPLWRIAQLQLGLNLADLDRHADAIAHLTRLLEEDPDDMRAYLALGGVHASQEDFAAAAALYDRAVARIDEPERADWNIFYQRGIAYERLKEWPKAEPNFRQALELLPDQPQVLNYLGYSWVDMNVNLEEGLDLIKRAVELRPSDGYIVDSLGWAYYRLERFEDAVRELERAVGLMPNDPILNDHLGDAYWRVGRRLEAGFQWRHAREMDPDAELLAAVERKLEDGLPSLEEERAAREVERAEAPDPNIVPLPEGARERQGGAHAQMETADAGEGRHVVRPGQSLWSIADEVLGDGNRYRELLELNPQLRGEPGRIVPGQELNLPTR